MRGKEAERILDQTADLLQERPWGVGILGFVPAELRNEQLDAIRKYRPKFALIAGGRPDQQHRQVPQHHQPRACQAQSLRPEAVRQPDRIETSGRWCAEGLAKAVPETVREPVRDT